MPRKPKTIKAVALDYKGIEDLPFVSASGAGETAREIIHLAKKFNVPIQEQAGLAESLLGVHLNSPISPETYRLVAEIICFLYRADIEWRKDHEWLGEVMK